MYFECLYIIRLTDFLYESVIWIFNIIIRNHLWKIGYDIMSTFSKITYGDFQSSKSNGNIYTNHADQRRDNLYILLN